MAPLGGALLLFHIASKRITASQDLSAQDAVLEDSAHFRTVDEYFQSI